MRSRRRRFPTRTLALFLLFVAAIACAEDSSANSRHTNRLIHEKSPYLLLHAHNPVDWYPWGKEAFDKARHEQKPIFLSIGYYTCHWCHVMERESYSNEQIAEVLNQYFVAVKVDREERPDIDRLYMAYAEATTGNGGWPLNVLLTPDLKPFLAGIYFAPDKLKALLLKTAEVWARDRDKLTSRASHAAQELERMVGTAPHVSAEMKPAVLDRTYQQIASTYDHEHGGFGTAPKFPRPVELDFLLRDYARTGKREALDMTLSTLRAMARGGIYDQLGGGFHRYTTDAQWRAPHFEKMLYDQAQLAATYCDAYQITHDPFFAEIARSVLDFSLREMKLPGGGFASALDADSAISPDGPGVAEGAFYTWSAAEIATVLGAKEAAVFDYAYGVESGGNVPPQPASASGTSEIAGRNVLRRSRDIEEAARHFDLSPAEIEKQLASDRTALAAVRSRRPRPPVDDKVVTAWNGLLITALARASQTLDRPEYLAAAESTARFIETKLYDSNSKRLRRSYREGSATVEGVLDDYADLIHGLVELYEADFQVHWLQWAVALQEKQDDLFRDAQQGGYFDASAADIALLARTHEAYDGAEPSPNATAAMNLLLLSQITDRKEWREEAQETLATFSVPFATNPESVPAMASALDFELSHSRQILIAGDPSASDTRELLRLVHQRFMPNKILLLADDGPGQQQLVRWLPFVAGAHRIKGKATAYICENYACRLPTSDPAVAAKLLDSPSNIPGN